MLKLKLQYFGHLIWRAGSLMLGKVEGRGGDGWMASLAQWTRVWTNSRRLWRTGKLGMLQSMRSQRVGYNLVTEQQRQPRPSEPSCSQPLSDRNSYLSPPYLLFSSNLFLKHTSSTFISGPVTSPLPLPGMLFAQVSAVFPHFLQASAQMTSSHEGLPCLLYKPATPTVSTIFSLTALIFSLALITKWSHNIFTCLLLIIFSPTRTQNLQSKDFWSILFTAVTSVPMYIQSRMSGHGWNSINIC